MKTFELKGTLRSELGRKAVKKIRQNDEIPCNLYGGQNNVHFSVKRADVHKLIYTPHVYLVDLTIGSEKHKGIIREIQTHPVTDQILHLDFLEVFDNKPVTVDIPVSVRGSAIGVRKGGKMEVFKRYLKVQGLPIHLPDEISVDVSDLDIGKTIYVKDIKIENVSFAGNLHDPVVGVHYARTVVEETPAAAAATTAATPEAGAAAAPSASAAPAATPAAEPKKEPKKK